MTEHMAGPELDALVAEKVMGWRWYYSNDLECCMSGPEGLDTDRRWQPSTRIQDAWEVVGAVRNLGAVRGHPADLIWNITIGDDNQCWAGLEQMPGLLDIGETGWDFNVEAGPHKAPHAICLAALKAVGEGS